MAPNVSAGFHGASWHNLPTRIKLSQIARSHYSPSKITQGLFDPNQFGVVYRMTTNAKKRQYNSAVQGLVNRFKAPGNVYEGNTPSKYRAIYGRVSDVSNFSKAFKNWQIANREEKNAKFSNLIQKLKRVKVIEARELLNFNNTLANYHSVLPIDVKKIIPLSKIRINRSTGAWNKVQVERALKAIHAVQKSRRT
jgi:catalase